MRIKILVLGDNPASLVADYQILRDKEFLVFTSYNLENINEIVDEIKPDVVFFDMHKQNEMATAAYNDFVNGIEFTHIPVIYTLSDDDVYLVTRKRTASKEKRNIVTDNIIDAVKMSLRSNKTYEKKITLTSNKNQDPGIQLPFFRERA